MGGTEDPDPFTVQGPVGQVVLSDRPTFSWRPLAGATSYRVSVFDAEGSKVAGTPEEGIPDTRWTPVKPLARGRVYEWEVIALREGEEVAKAPRPPAPPAKLQVVSPAKSAELARYAGSPLTRGILAAEAGLLDESELEFQKLLRANPRSEVARKLLSQVRAMRK
jgi:hypothetical protein